MPRTRLLMRLSRLCAAAAVSALISGPAIAQDETGANLRESAVGTRVQKTKKVDWESLRREEARRGRVDPQTGALLEAPPTVAAARREELDKARLPVLLPDDGRMVERMRLFAKENHYVAAYRDDAHSVQITGTRIAQGKLEAKRAPERMKAMSDEEGYVYQRTDYGCELSFTRYNVSYNISVECREPESDERCTGRDYVMQLAESLVYVGGGPASNDAADDE